VPFPTPRGSEENEPPGVLLGVGKRVTMGRRALQPCDAVVVRCTHFEGIRQGWTAGL
jgi:hypothetical protein